MQGDALDGGCRVCLANVGKGLRIQELNADNWGESDLLSIAAQYDCQNK